MSHPLRLFRFLALLPLLLAATGLLRGAASAPRPPNFLFIYTDDQRYDAVGVVQREQGSAGRYPWFQTPHLDRIAAEGMRFRNAFVVSSLCSPSRAAFLTGRYNHANGIANNHTPFPEDSVTHATLLRAAGYRTGYIGKWHMGPQRGARPGFDVSVSFVGQGRYFDCPIEVNGVPTPTTGWIDDVSTDHAISFLRDHRDRPFSLVVGYKACHGPFEPPARARERFAGARARVVPNLGVPAVYRPDGPLPAMKEANTPDAAGTVPVNLGYFRCLSAMDDNVGRLLQALDELGLAEDTVVIFTSDNGYYHGEHGLGDKRSAYDESLRIPLLVRHPRSVARGQVRDELVLNVDLAPTLVDLAGQPVPAAMQGRSWRPLFAGRGDGWRQAFLAEYFQEAGYPATPTVVAVRTTTAKLITYPGHEAWTELFDLRADPFETRNLAADPAHRDLLGRMQAELAVQARETGFVIPAYADPAGGDAAPKGAKKKKKA